MFRFISFIVMYSLRYQSNHFLLNPPSTKIPIKVCRLVQVSTLSQDYATNTFIRITY